MARRSQSLLLLWAALGCAEGGPVDPPPPPVAASVLIHNQSQFDLQELRVHRELDYSQTPNMLPGGLPIDGRIIYYGTGAFRVTVFRELYDRGPSVALTMADSPTLANGEGYTLIVFDQSFRFTEGSYTAPERAGFPHYGDPYPFGRPDAGGPAPADLGSPDLDSPDYGEQDVGMVDLGELDGGLDAGMTDTGTTATSSTSDGGL